MPDGALFAAQLFGIVTVLFVAAALGTLYGYLPAAVLDGLTAGSFGLFAVLAGIVAVGLYALREDR